jgi:hypothetical protein
VSAALVLGAPASGARPPTYLEKVTIMDAFNIPERSWSSRCARILVSTVNARYAMVTSPRRPPQVCVEAGQVGDGFELVVRPNRTSLRWNLVRRPCAGPLAAVRDDVGAVCF